MSLAEDILDGLDIVDVIGRYMALQRAGTNYKGLCPFHGEKTPSFVVSPQKQIFKCFGCGEGGDAITFVKKIDGVDFIDAAKILAKDAGVDMSKFENIKFDKKAEEWKDKLKRMNKIAMGYFVDQLKISEEAIDYVKNKRKLTAEIVKKFQLGFAPDSYYASTQYLKSKGFTEDELQQGSFAKRGHNSDQYAFYRQRLMFPIRDHMGNVIGFGGRAMKADQQPKYVNTTDTIVYNKSHVLYGLNFAKTGVKKNDFIAVVEGYMDVIAMSRLGYDNAVATCGTSLTDGHFKLLKRYSDHVYLLFDQDKAGFAATKRALKVAYKHDVYPAVLILPAGDAKDLDDYANIIEGNNILKKNEEGENNEETDVIQRMITQKVDGLSFVLDKLKTEYDLTSPVDKNRLLDDMMGMLVFVTNIAIQDHYVQIVSDSLKMSKQVLEAQLKQYIRKQGRVLRKEMQTTHSGDRAPKYAMDGELLIVALMKGDEVSSVLSGEQDEKLQTMFTFIKKIGKNTTEGVLKKYLEDDLNAGDVAEIEQLRLWWESEFERFNDDDGKLGVIMQTAGTEIQRLVKSVMKYGQITQDEKMVMLKEMRGVTQ